MFEISQRLLHHFVIPVWYCSHWKRSKTALRACSSSGLENVSSLRPVFFIVNRWPWAQDLAEPDEAYVSTLHKSAVKVLKFCSICASLVAKSPSVFVICESRRDIQVVIAGIWAICVSKCTNFERRASSFSCVVFLERVPLLWKSWTEPWGEPTFAEKGGEPSKEVCMHLHTRDR